MRIAAVIHQFPPDFTTGTEILCLRTAQALAHRGHDVRVFAADPRRPAGTPAHAETVQGISVQRIGTARPRRLLLARRMAEEFSNPAAQARLTGGLRAFAPDVIHLYHSLGFGLEAAPALAAVAPLIATVTDFHLACPMLTAAFEDGSTCAGPDSDGANCIAHLQRRERERLAGAGGIKRAGLALREALRRLPGADTAGRLRSSIAGRMEAAARALAAIDLTLVGPPRLYDMLRRWPGPRELFGHQAPPVAVPDRQVGTSLCAGYFSSISPHKGLHVLLDAIANIPQDTGMTFTICGPPGPDAAYVRGMAARAAADPRIDFKPGVPHERIGEEMGKADIVVVPSLWDENNPLVLLDALEAGRYVVASASTGMVGTLDEPRGGRSFPAGDAASLARILLELNRDPEPVQEARRHPVRRSQFAGYIDAIEARYAAVRERRLAAGAA
jgi:glycosyltransferase involved in cell wall biosynthesis